MQRCLCKIYSQKCKYNKYKNIYNENKCLFIEYNERGLYVRI